MTTYTVRPDVAAYLTMLRESGAPLLSELPVEAVRAAMIAMRDLVDVDPTPLTVVRDVNIPGPAGMIPARLYDRRGHRDAGPLVLYFHGGGFVFGNLHTHEPICTYLADQLDLPVLAVDYRLAPEHPFPAAVDDAEASARWAASSPAELGFPVTGLVTCGDSAGGNLSIITAQALAVNPAHVSVRAQWVFNPFVGGNGWASMDEFATGFMLTKAEMDWFEGHYAAPANHLRHNCLNGAVPPSTPLVVLTAGLDPLRDQGRAYAERAREAGVPVEWLEADGMIHGFVRMRRALPSAQVDIDAFIAGARRSLE